MATALILSNDFIFAEALRNILTDNDRRCLSVEPINLEKLEAFNATYRDVINTLKARKYSLLFIDLKDSLDHRLVNQLLHVKRHFPSVKIMAFTNNDVYCKRPCRLALINVCDMVVSCYDSITSIKRNILLFELLPIHQNFCQKKCDFFLHSILGESLSIREMEVLDYLIKGISPTEIAMKLYISPKTVYSHRHRIYAKLGVRNIMEFHMTMNLFSQNGLL